MESLRQLTALQRLHVEDSVGQPSDPSGFSMLEQLTALQLGSWFVHPCWTKFQACTGLRELHLCGASCLPALISMLPGYGS